MKIRKLTEENHPKVNALLGKAFDGSTYEQQLFADLHKHDKKLQEWICIHRNHFIAYIAFSNAYHDDEICGLHLAPLAVKPEFQNQGVGSELMRFALRQKPIKEQTIFVLGAPPFYQKFGFKLCKAPLCPFTKNNNNFLSLNNKSSSNFTVDYEPEFF